MIMVLSPYIASEPRWSRLTKAFADSAAATSGVPDTKDYLSWYADRLRAHVFDVERIPFRDLKRWDFEADTGNLVHDSRRFFAIHGLQVRTNFGPTPEWSQPIIDQPEIGILGIIAKPINGIYHFLMQAKMEPGNLNLLQLSPTVQATRSNYTRVHGGAHTKYLEYFAGPRRGRVLVDSLQSEQGSRFFRKRNRNMVVEVDDDLPHDDDFSWLTLGQVNELLQQDHQVNMDARTVLSCLPLDFDGSRLAGGHHALHSSEEILGWLTEMKTRYDLIVRSIPLRNADRWLRTHDEIRHVSGDHFSVVAVSVRAGNREVRHWTQPLIKPTHDGLIAFLAKRIDGVMHVLVQAKVEAGNLDKVELAPTVQCHPDSYAAVPASHHPPFLDYVLNARPHQIRYDTYLSEEGGRFYHQQNRYAIVETGDDFSDRVPENYLWMSVNQLKDLVNLSNQLNVEARSLLACIPCIAFGGDRTHDEHAG